MNNNIIFFNFFIKFMYNNFEDLTKKIDIALRAKFPI